MNNNNKFYEDIISFSNKFIYEKIETKNSKITEVYFIKFKNQKYILKINKQIQIQNFKLINKIINKIFNNDFPTPKLFYSKFNKTNKCSYFIFEYIEKSEKLNKNEQKIRLKIIKNLNKFYELTNDIEFEKQLETPFLKYYEDIEKFLNNEYHKNIIKNSLEYIKSNNNSNKKIIFRDINPDNIIQNKNNFYFIDFDLVSFGDKELDIAVFFVSFFSNNDCLEIKLNNLKELLNHLEQLNKEKIINYIILVFYNFFINIEEKEIKSFYLKNILLFNENKQLILNELN